MFRGSGWLLFQAQFGFLKAPVPFEGGIGLLGIDGVKDEQEVAFRTGRDINEVGDAAFRSLAGRTPALAHVLQALADALARVGLSCNIQQPLIGFGVLHNGGGLALYGQNVFRDVERRSAPI